MHHIFLTVTVLCRSTFGQIAYLTGLVLGKLFDVYYRNSHSDVLASSGNEYVLHEVGSAKPN